MGAYFATAPFFGAVVAVPLLGERIGSQAGIAAALISLGVGLLLRRHPHRVDVHLPLRRRRSSTSLLGSCSACSAARCSAGWTGSASSCPPAEARQPWELVEHQIQVASI